MDVVDANAGIEPSEEVEVATLDVGEPELGAISAGGSVDEEPSCPGGQTVVSLSFRVFFFFGFDFFREGVDRAWPDAAEARDRTRVGGNSVGARRSSLVSDHIASRKQRAFSSELAQAVPSGFLSHGM